MKSIYLAAVFAISATASQADDYTNIMSSYGQDHIVAWLSDPSIVAAIRKQNLRNSGLSQDDIDQLDLTWRQQVGLQDRPVIEPVLSNPAADALRSRIAASQGVVTEAFVMDNQGLNVAASDVTSDYWQGDEAKFTETFGRGTSDLHIGDIELDESTQTYQGQISVAITDPETGAYIGALTVGLNAEMLF